MRKLYLLIWFVDQPCHCRFTKSDLVVNQIVLISLLGLHCISFFTFVCIYCPLVVTNVVLLSCRQTNFGLGLSHAFFQNGILVCLFSQISCHLLLCRQFVSLLSKPDWFGVLSFHFCLYFYSFIKVLIVKILQSIYFPVSHWNIFF